jgi:hypothetical protein
VALTAKQIFTAHTPVIQARPSTRTPGTAMNLLIQSAMIFFATLMAAGLVALSEPQTAGLDAPVHAARAIRVAANTFHSFAPEAARLEARHPR